MVLSTWGYRDTAALSTGGSGGGALTSGAETQHTHAAWTGFIAEIQMTPISAQLLHQLPDVIRAMWNCPPVADFAATLPWATATDIVALWTSIPMNMLLCIWSLPYS